MGVRHPAGETITITRTGPPSGEYDEQQNPIPGPDVSIPVSDVALEPLASEETPAAPGVMATAGYRLYCPYGTEFLAGDRLTIRGVTGWQVVGDTAAAGWRNPFDGLGRGVVVTARRAG